MINIDLCQYDERHDKAVTGLCSGVLEQAPCTGKRMTCAQPLLADCCPSLAAEIGQKPPVGSGGFRPASVIHNWLIGKSQAIERAYEIRGDSPLTFRWQPVG